MTALRYATSGAALAGLVAAGVALTPSVHGQDRPPERRAELSILAGRGPELGIRVTDAKAGGVQVESVEPNTAADKAGLKRGDVIVEFDGEHVRSARQLARLVQETPAGRTVKAAVTRNGQRQELQITTEEARDSALMYDDGRFRSRLGDHFADLDRLRDLPFNFNFDFPAILGSGRLGASVDELTPQLADYFGAKEGLLVTSVSDGSAAAQAGLKAGDVITSVNGARIRTPADLVEALRHVDGGEATIGIVRDRKETSVKATIEGPRRVPRGARPV